MTKGWLWPECSIIVHVFCSVKGDSLKGTLLSDHEELVSEAGVVNQNVGFPGQKGLSVNQQKKFMNVHLCDRLLTKIKTQYRKNYFQ